MDGQIVPVIFARADSQRLPGKVLKPVLAGRSIVEELLQQLSCIASQVPIMAPPVIATTDRPADEPIVRAASEYGVAVKTGHLMPLMRLREIAEVNPESWLWRVNADSPLLLSLLIRYAADAIAAADADVKLITNLVERSFPYGVSLEMFRASMIAEINLGQSTEDECEHLSPLVWTLQSHEVCNVVAGDIGLSSFDPTVRLTIDLAEDARFFSSLWDDPEFQKNDPGSVERVDCAYRRRLLSET